MFNSKEDCNRNYYRFKFLFILVFFLFYKCGVSITQKENITIPQNMNFEVFRFNLFSGEVENLFGVNIGFNNKVNTIFGLQFGFLNDLKRGVAMQLGILNFSDTNKKILKLGIVNILFPFDKRLENNQVPLGDKKKSDVDHINSGLQRDSNFGLSLGIVNISDSFNIGLLNIQEGESAFSLGVFNYGISGYQLGVLNYCSKSFLPYMIIINFCNAKDKDNL
ncbi:MAG TPA: hypothetical protein PLS71_10725 [Leptospiraceae bacterium]|nr:hypothetical protein [Leptospiraceae bacterium]HNB98705.1 hypothetical protein [Leptospiraceae bacterium]HNE07833.1 hypothetical protein [Leptospiraceae bacterium]HNI91058.1 hypothetical protein [Leptospiraceae bacterium]HNK56466.1 hypothetical protein [Leptospiraceae bacterium]